MIVSRPQVSSSIVILFRLRRGEPSLNQAMVTGGGGWDAMQANWAVCPWGYVWLYVEGCGMHTELRMLLCREGREKREGGGGREREGGRGR